MGIAFLPFMEVKMGVVSLIVITFQILRHFPLNHDYGRKSKCHTKWAMEATKGLINMVTKKE